MPNPTVKFSIRLNAHDAMGVADAIDKLGISKENLSFSQACKIVLSASLESLRQAEAIPKRDVGDFSEIMAPFERPNFSGRSHARFQVEGLQDG